MLPYVHAVCALLAVLSSRLLLMRRRIAAHRSSRSVIWALRKAMPTLGAVKFENKPANDVLRDRPRWIDPAHFFITPEIRFQNRSAQ